MQSLLTLFSDGRFVEEGVRSRILGLTCVNQVLSAYSEAMVFLFCFLFIYLLIVKQVLYVVQLSWNSQCKLRWPQTQRSA